MEVKEKTFAKLLSDNRTFVIPSFQRRYAWKLNNFQQLWDDIVEVVGETRKRHFMGTVVFDPDDDRRCSVIDGQQRIATFTIILVALKQLSAKYATTYTKQLQKILDHRGVDLIKPSLNDRESFDVLLTNPQLLQKGSHKSVRECYDFYLNAIDRYIESVAGQKPTHFKKIFDVVMGKLVFVEIKLNDDDDTHAIFETINYAGVPLTSADLARNFILSRAKNESEQIRLNNDYWQPLERLLSESLAGSSRVRKAELQKVLPEFLRAVLVLEKRKYISSTDLFRELRAYFSNRNESIEAKLIKIRDYSKEYCKFLKPENEGRSNLRKQLYRMLELRMTTYNSVLLMLFRSNAQGGIKTTELQVALQYIESFIVRRLFNSKVSRDLPKVFAKVASALCDVKQSSQLLVRLAQLLKDEKWPDDSEFGPCFLSTPIYLNAPATARFSLLCFEQQHENSKEIVLDSKVQIEHIFPQTAKADEWDIDSMAELKKRLNVMGNLTLTAYNPKLRNFGFDKKKKLAYRKSPYRLTKTLAKYPSWTAKEVDDRANSLLKLALKMWPYPT